MDGFFFGIIEIYGGVSMRWFVCLACCLMLCGCSVVDRLRQDEDLGFLIDRSEEFLNKVGEDERVRKLMNRAKEISYELRDDAKEKLSEVDYEKLLQEAKEVEEELRSLLENVDWNNLE